MTSVILCAAGKGSRAGFAENKALRESGGMPVLCYSLSAFAPFADEILVACSAEDEPRVFALLSPYPTAKTVVGGRVRAESVWNCLKEAKGEIVLVHDAARPFVSARIIESCLASVRKYGSGVCSLPATDTTVLARENLVRSVPAREEVFTVQTPQGFLKKELLLAYERAFAEGRPFDFTDESGLYARYIAPPRLFRGERTNRKLTFREDFSPAERVGIGIDTHAFGAPCGEIVLAGVRIPAQSGLIAHSDGDVLAHAVTDALLSAAGLRDIGYYFPETDETYRGADSMKLLSSALQTVRETGFEPLNVSVAVLAEHPRLFPYIETMRENLAETLGLPRSAVAIAAGTNEKLGYIGEGRGITVHAAILLKTRNQNA